MTVMKPVDNRHMPSLSINYSNWCVHQTTRKQNKTKQKVELNKERNLPLKPGLQAQ
jgi:hypothetical protein